MGKKKKKKKKIIWSRLFLLIGVFVLTMALIVFALTSAYRFIFGDEESSLVDLITSSDEDDESTSEDSEQIVIVLDPGHGGDDGGSESIEGITEAEVNLAIALATGEYVESLNSNVTVVYTRDDEGDYNMMETTEKEDLASRVQVVEDSGAVLFVSIHMNSYDWDNEAYGHEVWMASDSDTADENLILATNIDDALDALGYNYCRGIKDESESSMYVLRNNTVPAVLLELGYINTASDFDYIYSDEGTDAIAQAIAEGIIETLQDLGYLESEASTMEKINTIVEEVQSSLLDTLQDLMSGSE